MSADESEDMRAAKFLIIDLCSALELHMEKRKFHKKNGDDEVYAKACKWLAGESETPAAGAALPEGLGAALAKFQDYISKAYYADGELQGFYNIVFDWAESLPTVAEDAAAAYCSLNCPSVKKTGAEWTHTKRCQEIHALAATPKAEGLPEGLRENMIEFMTRYFPDPDASDLITAVEEYIDGDLAHPKSWLRAALATPPAVPAPAHEPFGHRDPGVVANTNHPMIFQDASVVPAPAQGDGQMVFPAGTGNCPICNWNEPHRHGQDELAERPAIDFARLHFEDTLDFNGPGKQFLPRLQYPWRQRWCPFGEYSNEPVNELWRYWKLAWLKSRELANLKPPQEGSKPSAAPGHAEMEKYLRAKGWQYLFDQTMCWVDCAHGGHDWYATIEQAYKIEKARETNPCSDNDCKCRGPIPRAHPVPRRKG